MTDIHEKLRAVQVELHAPKSQTNSFGGYSYRSFEDILEAAKPVLAKHGLTLVVSDDVVQVGDRIYVKATSTVTDGNESVAATGWAREAGEKKGTDESQRTGMASSYARKYSASGLLALDDSKDADTDEHRRQVNSAPDTLSQIKAAMKLRNVSKADVDSHVAARHGFGSLSEALGNERVLLAVLGWVEEQ